MKFSLPWWLPLALVAALAVAIWLAIVGWQRAGAAKAETERVTEAAKMEADGLKAAHLVTQRELEDQIRAKGYLHDYVTQLDAAGVKVKPVATYSGSTGQVPIQPGVQITVGGTGQASPPPSLSGAVQVPASAGGTSPAGAGPAVCRAGEILIPGGAVWVTEKGNVTSRTQGQAWCANPRALLFEGPVTADISSLKPGTTTRGSGLGIGGAFSIADRLRVGAAIAPPTFSILWGTVQVDSTLSLQCDPSTFSKACKDQDGHSTLMLGGTLVGRVR